MDVNDFIPQLFLSFFRLWSNVLVREILTYFTLSYRLFLNVSLIKQVWQWSGLDVARPVNMNWAFQKIWLITSDPRFNNGGGQLLFHRDQLGLDSFLKMHSSLCIYSGIFPLMLKVISWSEPCKCLLRLCCGFAVQFPVCVWPKSA